MSVGTLHAVAGAVGAPAGAPAGDRVVMSFVACSRKMRQVGLQHTGAASGQNVGYFVVF